MRRVLSFVLALIASLAMSAHANAQMGVCGGVNYLTTVSNGSWGLPAARTLAVRFTPAVTMAAERVEFYFAPSILTIQSGGTVGIVQQSATAPLPSNAAGSVLATGQWNGTTALPGWDGATLTTPVLLTGGVSYWLTTTANPVTVHQAVSYEDTGPDPTSYALMTGGPWIGVITPHRFKARVLSTACLAAPEFQVDQSEASAAVNGVFGTAVSPATLTVAIGGIANYSLSSTTLVGAPWDIVIGVAPLVSASAGGITLTDGQIVNVDLTDPALTYLFTPTFNGFPFVNLSGTLGTGFAMTRSFQMGLIDPGTASGLRLSQATHLIVQ
ncbi:MAG: hypothetical protein VX913_07440 [Planctomycetota bacterium]|nr:hypothetical protein [Planctomycetota bacterium]